MGNNYSDITDEIRELTRKCVEHNRIDPELYGKYDVKRGLRDINGKGVLAGLTEISEVRSSVVKDGVSVPCEGELFYRGINVRNIIDGFVKDKRFGFEEIVYLLLYGELPSREQLDDFSRLLGEYRTLPTNFVRDVIMKAPSDDMMNTLAKSILTLHSYDSNANDISLDNVMRQCLQLIAVFPILSVYGFQAYNFYIGRQSFFIHLPDPEKSTAENILYLLRPDCKYTELEARVLDIALVLHAEHGGGNNSTFTTHVVTSSGTDTYSAIAAALCSLKGPKHGGANIKVMKMFDDLKANVRDWNDDEAIEAYLTKLLHKEAFDKAGLIYGMGHAVYSISDPRAKVFRRFVKSLSQEKGLTDEFNLYSKVEELAPKVIAKEKKIYKGVSANVDFYSGFAYSMLGLPMELYTPIFAVARIAGWSAHRMEELINAGKIIRPAYKSVSEEREYTPLSER
ncbi:citrate/2-methylcitrate synthase [Ruminococcus sp. Marseille-P6503]|uniref:citrate/2-methylcitrate synthase n=1 Tax=Ruminococcus sp. Marseille-P6503 TaxID=2364796 RepID=UPI000F543BAC|nr:citrate/2-methylcitrate synthase [Ruminococcus sp. Marseille-P6503]